MLSHLIIEEMNLSFNRLTHWVSLLPEPARQYLWTDSANLELSRLSLVEGYWRIRETTPLILAAIATANRAGDLSVSQFWGSHLQEELGHDQMMYVDLCAHFQSPSAAAAALSRHPASPASAALLGYFHWQVRYGKSDLLAILRWFLEVYVQQVGGLIAAQGDRLGVAFTTLDSHREADSIHAVACRHFLDERLESADMSLVIWTIKFIADRLIDAQLWIVDRLLEQHA